VSGIANRSGLRIGVSERQGAGSFDPLLGGGASAALDELGSETAVRGQQILAEPPAALAVLPPKDLAHLEEILARLDPMPAASATDVAAPTPRSR
jgi:hypothetical protein